MSRERNKVLLQILVDDAYIALDKSDYTSLMKAFISLAELRKAQQNNEEEDSLIFSDTKELSAKQTFNLSVFKRVWKDIPRDEANKAYDYLAANAQMSDERKGKVIQGLKIFKQMTIAKQNDEVKNYVKSQEQATINSLYQREQAKLKADQQNALAEERKNMRVHKRMWASAKNYFANLQESAAAYFNKQEEINHKLAKTRTEIELARETIALQDAKAFQAIKAYETRSQKARRYLAQFIAAGVSFAFGAVETGVAVVLMLSSWPAWGIYLLATPLAIISTWINWRNFKPYVPALFKDISGQNKFFDGLTTYRDEKGVMQELTPARKYGLAVFAVFAALPTGIAIGALGYTSTLAIPTLPWIGGLVAGVSSIFPPIAIGLAAIVTIAIICMSVKTFSRLLQNKDFTSAVKKPFQEVGNIFADKTDKDGNVIKGPGSPAAKRIAYVVTGLFAVIALVGLGMACFTTTRSIGRFLIDQFNTAPAVAAKVGIAICAGPAFVSRIWSTFQWIWSASATILKRIYPNKDEKGEKAGVGKVGLAVLEAGMEGVFYGQGLQSGGTSTALVAAAATTTSIRTLGGNAAHIDDPEDNPKEVDVTSQAMAKRHDKNLNRYGFFKWEASNDAESAPAADLNPAMAASS